MYRKNITRIINQRTLRSADAYAVHRELLRHDNDASKIPLEKLRNWVRDGSLYCRILISDAENVPGELLEDYKWATENRESHCALRMMDHPDLKGEMLDYFFSPKNRVLFEYAFENQNIQPKHKELYKNLDAESHARRVYRRNPSLTLDERIALMNENQSEDMLSQLIKTDDSSIIKEILKKVKSPEIAYNVAIFATDQAVLDKAVEIQRDSVYRMYDHPKVKKYKHIYDSESESAKISQISSLPSFLLNDHLGESFYHKVFQSLNSKLQYLSDVETVLFSKREMRNIPDHMSHVLHNEYRMYGYAANKDATESELQEILRATKNETIKANVWASPAMSLEAMTAEIKNKPSPDVCVGMLSNPNCDDDLGEFLDIYIKSNGGIEAMEKVLK